MERSSRWAIFRTINQIPIKWKIRTKLCFPTKGVNCREVGRLLQDQLANKRGGQGLDTGFLPTSCAPGSGRASRSVPRGWDPAGTGQHLRLVKCSALLVTVCYGCQAAQSVVELSVTHIVRRASRAPPRVRLSLQTDPRHALTSWEFLWRTQRGGGDSVMDWSWLGTLCPSWRSRGTPQTLPEPSPDGTRGGEAAAAWAGVEAFTSHLLPREITEEVLPQDVLTLEL